MQGVLLDPDDRRDATELLKLDRATCLTLLAAGDVGRVILTHAVMPAAHPISYVLDSEEVLSARPTRRCWLSAAAESLPGNLPGRCRNSSDARQAAPRPAACSASIRRR